MGPYSTVLIKRLTSMKGLVGTSKAARCVLPGTDLSVTALPTPAAPRDGRTVFLCYLAPVDQGPRYSPFQLKQGGRW